MVRFFAFLIAVSISAGAYLSARTIHGNVLSEADSTAVTAASCRLIKDSADLATSTVDSTGHFSLSTDASGPITLEISMQGYITTEIIIEQNTKDLQLGSIFLSEEVSTLNELTVTTQGTTERRGRTIVYPSAADVKASATSLGLFRKLPFGGLEANPITRTLKVDGGTPMILINGIPSSIDDVNALLPKDIEKIEFSRITPARYMDKGVSGLIEITLKKRNDGGQVYLWGRSAVNTAFVDGNMRASYHQGPSQFTVMYNTSWRNYQRVYDNSVESYIAPDFRADITGHDRNPFNYFFNQGQIRYDYSPSTNTLFSATFKTFSNTAGNRKIGDLTDNQYESYELQGKTSSKDLSPSLDLFLRQDFNKDNSMEVQIVGTLSSNDYRRTNTYDFADGTQNIYDVDVDSRRRSLISEINYIHDFSERTTLSGGFQNTMSHSTNKYLTSDYKPVLTENNNYIFARLGQQIGPIYLSLATGVKLFWVKNDMNKRHFVRNLTNVRASWTINSKWSLNAGFRYTPSIPSISSLTDYPQQSTPYLISNGNPDLKVSERFQYTVSGSFRHKKFSVSAFVGYLDIKDMVTDDVRYLGNGIFLNQSVNISKQRMLQNELQFRISDLAGFGAALQMDLNHYNSAGDGWKHNLTSFNGSISLWWNHGPITIEYWRKLPGKYLTAHYVGKDENGDALSFNYQPDKHWMIGVSWMYMFDVKGTRYPSWNLSDINPSTNQRYIKDNGNMVTLSVRYSADFGSLFRTARRNLNNSDNGSSLLKL